MYRKTEIGIVSGAIAFALLLSLSLSSPVATTFPEKADVLTSALKFDYFTWILDATWIKLEQAALGIPAYLGSGQRKQAVLDYISLTRDIEQTESHLDQMFADPAVKDKEAATANLRAQLADLQHRQGQLGPIAEAVLQSQVSQILAQDGLTAEGQPLPAVLYRTSATPNFLVVSPRQKIGTEYSASLVADMNVDQMAGLENQVDKTLDVSSLVVPTGGVGAYPTMIMRTSDLHWLTQVIAHEWTHNYLYWHPLGFLYEKSPQLRSMNETTADIVGKEVGERVLRHFYPEYAALTGAPKPVSAAKGESLSQPASPPAFDFRREMHETRVTADALLAQGKVDQAESYMEQRRKLFWDNGYAIRKLNQAYFAFYGSYADVPGGAAGEDPVGPAVRALRSRSASLADFLHQMSGLTSFEQLQSLLAHPSS